MHIEHNILHRSRAVEQQLQGQGSESGIKTYMTKLDRMDLESKIYLLAATRKADKPLPSGIYEWSPRLKKVGRMVTYWKLRLKLLQFQEDLSEYLEALKRDTQVVDSGSKKKEYVKVQLKKA